jgi:nanoRNase/pAp phosphatase (c-di-AMP/oligoRNAs hydrolase)
MKTYGENIGEILTKLDQIFDGQKKLLVILHNNPDPDALASALAFSYLTQKRYNVQTDITYGGLIGRAENQAMVKELIKIPFKRINRIRYSIYDRIALLDTQPGVGNNSFPSDVECHIVIDHHPRCRGAKAALMLLNPQIGATATMLIQLLEACKLPISTDLATALTYAIRSETMDLGREVSEQDIKAYFTVYPKASMHKLARITCPKLPRSYFVVLANTLERARVFRHLICVHLNQVPMPEIVAEMADTLLRHQRISWVLCTGRFKKNLILSLRSSNPKAKAGKLIKDLVPDRNNAGGHDLFAGGRIEIHHLQEAEIDILEIRLAQQFAELLGYKNADWKPLLENS